MTERIVWVDLLISPEWNVDVCHEGKWLTLYPARIDRLPAGMEPDLRAYGVDDWDRNALEADLGAMLMTDLDPAYIADSMNDLGDCDDIELGVQPKEIYLVAGLVNRDSEPCRVLGTLELRRTEETHGCDHRQGVA